MSAVPHRNSEAQPDDAISPAVAGASGASDRHLELLARVRNSAKLKTLSFLIANETHNVVPYFQAIVWDTKRSRLRLRTVSGASTIDPKAAVVRDLRNMLKLLVPEANDAATTIDAQNLPGNVQSLWLRYLPRHGVVLPFGRQNGDVGLLLTREIPFDSQELERLKNLSDAYAWQWHWLGGETEKRSRRRRFAPWFWTLGIGLFLAAVTTVVQVPSTTVGNVEIAAADPVIIAAPITGVINRVHIEPWQSVTRGDPLLDFVSDTMQSELELAEKNLAVALADHERARQESLTDRSAAVDAKLASLRVEQSRVELKYARDTLTRAVVRSPISGMALLNDANAWSRRPVQTGERIMQIADTNDVVARIWVPVGAFTRIDRDFDVAVNLDVDPGSSLPATIDVIGMKAETAPDGSLAYRIDARFDNAADTPRIGLMGTARVHGESTSLWSYITRRPYARIRQWLGAWF